MGAKNLELQLVEYALAGKKTGLRLVDNLICDALNEERMATKAELASLKQPSTLSIESSDSMITSNKLSEFEIFQRMYKNSKLSIIK